MFDFFKRFRKKKITDDDFEALSFEEIQSHKTLSDEVVSVAVKGSVSEHRVQLKQSLNLNYFIFTYISGKSVMNWVHEDYILANKKINIGDTPIYFCSDNKDKIPVPISMDYRKK